MIPYVVFFVLLIASAFLPRFYFPKHQRLQKIAATVVPITLLYLFSALKSTSVGIDTSTYLRFYLETLGGQHDFSSLVSHFDYGLSALFLIFAKVGANYYVLQAFIYLLMYVPLGYAVYKTCTNPSLSLIPFCCLWMLTFNLSGIRQGIAISFLLCFFVSIAEKPSVIRYLFAFVSIVCAFAFHPSSIVGLVAIPLFLVRKHGALIKYLLVVSLVFFVFAPTVYQGFYYLFNFSEYGPSTQSGVGEYFLIYLLISIFVLVANQRKELIDDAFAGRLVKANTSLASLDDYLFLKNETICVDKTVGAYFILLYTMALFAEGFARIATSINRFGYFFLPIGSLLLPNYILRVENRAVRLVLIGLFCLASLFLFWYSNLRVNYLNCTPYVFLWE